VTAPARASSRSSLPALPARTTSSPQQHERPAARATATAPAAAAEAALSAAGPTPQEAVEILFAGYSDIAGRLQAAHQRIERLEKNGGGAPAAVSAAATAGGGGASPCARQPWDAAMFLLFFLGFINVAGWIALWRAQAAIGAASAAAPWWAALAPGGGGGGALVAPSAPLLAVLLKRLVLFFVPLTNTAVVLTFCVAAVRAALACLRAWE